MTEQLRRSKFGREEFRKKLRSPIFVVLDGVRQGYNIGAVFRLCDAFLVQHLTICQAGPDFAYKKRSLVSAAAGTQGWVPWSICRDAADAVRGLKADGLWIVAVENNSAQAHHDRRKGVYTVEVDGLVWPGQGAIVVWQSGKTTATPNLMPQGAPAAAHATILLAAAVMVTTVLVPFVTAFVARSVGAVRQASETQTPRVEAEPHRL